MIRRRRGRWAARWEGALRVETKQSEGEPGDDDHHHRHHRHH